jgi:AbrB family looped-hinge helix DNA binding protein
MNAYTRVSEKGQVVVPKATRDRLGWLPGTNLDVIDAVDGVFLRQRDLRQTTLTVDEAVVRFRSLYRHEGAPLSIDQLGWTPSDEVDDDA